MPSLLISVLILSQMKQKSGYRLVGDVNYDDVKDKVHAISPVPGGVGPMTIAMLLKHTVDAAEQHSLL